MHPTSDIDPSPEDREKIREMLQAAHEFAKNKGHDAEVFLKENKKDLDEESRTEAEKDIQKFRRYSDTLEDALAKSENTKGRTLKKAFGKKTLSVVKDSLPDAQQFTSLEEILHNNGLA